MVKLRLGVVVMALSAATMNAHAAGALAVGMVNGDRSQGTAVGWSINYPNEGEAKYAATVFCLEQTAPAEARVGCRVVTTFNNRCVAVAWDPGGKPGWGWSVNADKSRAQRDALTECSAKAGTTANGCKVVLESQCDTTGSGEKIARAPSSTEPVSMVTPMPAQGGGSSDSAITGLKP